MPTSITMTDRQMVPVGATILDQDGQPYAQLPAGVTVKFETSDDTILDVEVQPDGMNANIRSDRVGTATITVSVEGVDPPIPADTVEITVINSQPGSLNLTVGAPADET